MGILSAVSMLVDLIVLSSLKKTSGVSAIHRIRTF